MSRATARTLDGWAAYPVEDVVRYDGAFVLVRTVRGDYWAHRAYVTVTQCCPARWESACSAPSTRLACHAVGVAPSRAVSPWATNRIASAWGVTPVPPPQFIIDRIRQEQGL